MDRLVTIKSNRYGMELRLDPNAAFVIILKAGGGKIRGSAPVFLGAQMAISFSGRTLNLAEENELIGLISDITGIDIVCIIDHDQKNELLYKSIVEQTLSNVQKREGQFYRGTLGRRQVLESESSIVILGDVEPGAEIIAKGSIVIVGELYGSVHAGASGDSSAHIVALSMQPKRLRIGDIEAKRQIIYQESLSIKGPKIAVVDGRRIYLDPLVD